MNTYLKPLAAVAAVVAIAFIGFSLIGGSSRTGVGGPGPTASPSPSDTPGPSDTPSPSNTPGPSNAAVGRLAAGTWDSRAFAYPLTYTVPTGWRNMEDYPDDLRLQPEGAKADDGITLWAAVYVAAQDAACTESPDPGRGHKAADFIDLLTTHPGVVASTPAAVTVGGLQGSLVDVALAPSWKATCPFSEGQPFVPFVTDSLPGPGMHQGIAVTERARLIFLDAKDGETILIYIDSVDGTTFDAIVGQSMPIVESIVFRP